MAYSAVGKTTKKMTEVVFSFLQHQLFTSVQAKNTRARILLIALGALGVDVFHATKGPKEGNFQMAFFYTQSC